MGAHVLIIQASAPGRGETSLALRLQVLAAVRLVPDRVAVHLGQRLAGLGVDVITAVARGHGPAELVRAFMFCGAQAGPWPPLAQRGAPTMVNSGSAPMARVLSAMRSAWDQL